MTDTEVDRPIEDAKIAEQEVFIRDDNGKVFTDNKTQSRPFGVILENSELDLASNLSSSTEIKTEENERIRRSKRLTKTNPIVRYNNPICHTGHTVGRLNSGPIPSQTETGHEGEESI